MGPGNFYQRASQLRTRKVQGVSSLSKVASQVLGLSFSAYHWLLEVSIQRKITEWSNGEQDLFYTLLQLIVSPCWREYVEMYKERPNSASSWPRLFQISSPSTLLQSTVTLSALFRL